MKSEESKLKKVKREIKEYAHKPIAKELLIIGFIVVLIALVAFIFVAGPRIIGFFAAGEQKAYSDVINEKFAETYEYNWTLQNVPAGEFQLTSVKLSGAITGNAKVYLVTDSSRLLIFDSSNLKTGPSPITAFAAADTESSSSSDESTNSQDQAEQSSAGSSGLANPLGTAQPEPPSSGELSSPDESQPNEADTTSGSGAEIPPTEEPPAEEIPPVEQPPAEEPANETQPTEIPTENITIPEENVTTLENVTENQTIEIPLAEEILFETVCEETCYISEMLNKSSYILQIEIESEAVLKLDSIYYELLISQVENITNETVFFATGIEDSSNNTIAATIEFVDAETDELEAIGKSEEKEKSIEEIPLFQGAAVVEEETGEAGLDIPKGKYDIKVKPQNHPVKEIIFDDLVIDENVTEFIKLDDVPETGDYEGYAEVYAIDPTGFEFTEATVTVEAKGTVLYKCANWDFATQECLGTCSDVYDDETNETYQFCIDWVFLQAITPGETYSFTLTPDDPGFAEGSPSSGTPDAGYVTDNEGDDEEGGTYTATQADDTTYFYAGETSTDTLNSVIVLEYNISSLGITGADITNMTFSATYCHDGSGSAPAACDGDAAEGSWTGTQDVWIYNWTSSTWVDIGDLRTNDGGNTVVDSYTVTSGLLHYVNSSGWVRTRYEAIGSVGDSQDSWLVMDYVPLTINYIDNDPPTTPTSITCDGSSCNSIFYEDVNISCSGSTDADNDTITYVIDAYYNHSTSSETATQVPSSCSDSTYASGSYEFYSQWTIPGSGTATLTKLWFWQADTSLSASETLEMALYSSGGNQISEEVTLTGTGASGWISGTLATPITITLGQTYYVGVAPISATYNLGRDDSANCANYPPTGTGSYYESSTNNDLDSTVPTGSQSGNKYIIPGITYTIGGYNYSWTAIGNHTNESTYLWNLSGIAEQSNVDLRCRAIDLAGSNTYSDYSAMNYNLTIASTPPPDTTPPAAVTNLNETSTGTTWIYWAWTNPGDSDFSEAIIYVDGSNILNTSNAYYNATGFSCNTTHNITINTKDTTGNVNTTNVMDSAVTLACSDTTPPAAVTNLAVSSRGATWIYWTWTNPADSDFNHTEIWIDGSYTANVSTPSSSYNATGFSAATSHTIGTRTADNSGNVNATFVNNTAQTYAVSADQNNSVTNAAGAPVNVALTIINSTGQTVYSQTNTVHNFDLFGGNYTIIIQPASSASVSAITYYNYTVDGSFALPGLDEPTPAAGSLAEFAVNPLGQFQTATLTVNPAGDVLTRCDNYTYTLQSCDEDYWATEAYGLTPGTLYNITFVPGDQTGFAAFNFTTSGGFEVQGVNTYSGTAVTNDSYIRAGSTGSNYGSASSIRVGRSGGAGVHRGIIKFNLSSIPSGVRIDNANLSLYMFNNVDGAGARTHGAHKVQQSPARNWVELQVTWNVYSTGNSWTTTGGDFAANELANTSVNAVGFYYWNVTADVQNFTDNQAQNFGWIIKDETESGTNRKYYVSSNDATNTSRQPRLIVNWTDIQPPRWSSQSQNASVINNTGSIKLSAYWTDNVNLSYAMLSTNESGGVWANKTGVYGSPLQIGPSTGNWSNFTWSNSSASGIIGWRIWANDTQGNWNSTNIMTFNVTVPDITPPTVTQNSPANNAVDGDGSVLFNCSATDNIALANISLYINSVLNQTNIVTGTSNSTTFSKTMTNGNYNWYCRASDAAGNANNSATYALAVNTAAVPISTNYTGNTTNWATLPDLTNVCNGQAVLEIPSYGQIQWQGCVNAASQNFDTYVNISDNFISVDFGLNPTFNSSAQLKLRGLNWSDTEDFNVLINGEICSNTTCQNVTYENTTGTVTFDVAHFTNFSTNGTSRLLIWDQNDTGMPGNNRPACVGSSIDFYAYYYRVLGGNNFTNTGATCIINFTDSTGNSMTYNATSNYYQYARTFSSTGLKAYNVSCIKTTFPTRPRITVSDSINITDCAPPTTALVNPPNGSANGKDLNFTCNATDNYQLANMTLYWNYTGIFSADSTNIITGTSNETTFQKTNLNNGIILWNCLACDTSNNCAFAPANWTVTVDATPPVVNLMSPGNNTTSTTQTQNFIFNATDNQYTTINCTLYINDAPSGTNASVANNTATTITNTTVLEGYNQWYVNCTDGASNTGQSETRLLTVDATPPVIVHIRPVQNDILGFTTTLEVNVTDNLVGVNSVWYEITNTSGIVKSGTMSGTEPIYNDTWDTTTVSEGNYTFTAYANDTLGNQQNSSVNFTIDNTPPLIQIFTPLNNSQWGSNFNLNVFIQNNMLTASSYNITNSTGAIVQSNSNNSINQPIFNWTDLVNVGALPSGTYNLTVYARNNVGYPSFESVLFVIDKTPPQYFNLSESPASPTTYSPTQTYEFNATWTDNYAVGTVIFEFNGTNYTNAVQSGDVYSKTFVGLNAGSYNYKWYANDTAGNSNSTGTFTYIINKMPTTTSLYLNGAQANATITYGAQSNATAITSAGSVALYRNGTNVTNPEIATLGAGTYNYTAINSGDSNYLPSSETWFLTVNKATPTVNLLLDGVAADKSVTYPTQTNATAFESNTNDSDVTYTMYRNSTTIGSGSVVSDVATLGVNTYVYTYNTTGGENYTSNTINRTLTVGIQPTAVDLYLNGAQNNLTVTYGTSTNVTAIGYNGTVALYRNGTNVGTSEITTLAVGYYNYTAVIPTDANKTGSSKTFFLTVNIAQTYVNLSLNGAESDLNITYPQTVTAVFSTNLLSATMYRNGTNINAENNTAVTLAAGYYNYTVVNPGDFNHTASSKTFFVTVNKAAANITLLLNGTNSDFNVNRSQTVNITGIRNAGEGNMQLYDNGALINNGAPIITNLTSYVALGPRNITLILPETQNYTAATSTHFLNVFGILYAYVTAPTGTPKYYEGQNITFKGYVYDELANPITGANAKFEPINGSFVYACYDVEEGSGFYNCTLDTTGMASPKIYDARINATKTYYHAGVYTNNSVFLLESGQKANLLLHKIPSVQAINSSHITYNISLYLANGRGTSENTILTDPDASQNWSIGSIYGAQEVIESYLLTYARGSVDNTITLQKANATGYDPFYNTSLFVESNQPIIVIPQNITAAQLILIKNVAFVNQTTTNITYLITDQIVNAGGEDLTGISVVDSDIGLTTFVNLTRGASVSFNGTKLIAKSSQSYTYNFTQATASANAVFYYSNQPSVQIPGYGGPYDVIIDSLPASVTAGSTITGVVKAINMNSEISEDRTLTTWIEDSFGNITALDVRTIFIGRNQSATAAITLTAPSTPGAYLFVSKLTWPTADANASKAFDVTSAVIPPVVPPAPAPAVGVPVNITAPVLPPGVPQDIINSLIELRNMYNELKTKTTDLDNILKAAEDAAARGNYDLARNLIKSAYGMVQEIQLEICGKALPAAGFVLPTLPSINIAQFFGGRWLWWILAATVTVIFIIALIVKRREEMALEVELLAEERKHLERLYDKVSNYLNRKITRGDKDNGI